MAVMLSKTAQKDPPSKKIYCSEEDRAKMFAFANEESRTNHHAEIAYVHLYEILSLAENLAVGNNSAVNMIPEAIRTTKTSAVLGGWMIKIAEQNKNWPDVVTALKKGMNEARSTGDGGVFEGTNVRRI